MGYDSPPRRRDGERDRSPRRDSPPRRRHRYDDSPPRRERAARSRSREREDLRQQRHHGGGGGGGGDRGRGGRERDGREGDERGGRRHEQEQRSAARPQAAAAPAPPEAAEAAPAAAAAAAAAPPQPDFGVSGKLAAEANEVNGVAVKFQPPPEAKRCTEPRWRLYCFKGDTQVGDPLPLDKYPYFLFGKERRVADIPTDHPSCSRQHAVIVFREVEGGGGGGGGLKGGRPLIRPYIVDLETVNGTFVNGDRVEAGRYVELLERDVIRFGLSTREYVLLNERSAG